MKEIGGFNDEEIRHYKRKLKEVHGPNLDLKRIFGCFPENKKTKEQITHCFISYNPHFTDYENMVDL